MSSYIGKIYTFESVAFPGKMLNVYGSAGNNVNVVLWDADGSPEQKWKVSVENGFKLESMSNTNYVLSRVTDSTNNANVQTDETEYCDHQQIAFSTLLNGTVKIVQSEFSGNTYVRDLYLTAAGGANGANVYWSTEGSSEAQCWRMTEIYDRVNTMPTKQYLVSPFLCTAMTADYDTDCEMIAAAKAAGGKVCKEYPYTVHHGIDLIGSSRTDIKTSTRDIKASGFGEVIRVGDGTYLGNTLLIKYPNAAYGTGTSKRDVYFLYCHLESINVSEGDIVNPEDVIAVEGMTGVGATAVHLHLEAYTAAITDSPSDKGTSVSAMNYLIDPTIFFFNKTEGADHYNRGKRILITDNEPPYNRAAYCNGYECEHGEILYFYNIQKVQSRGSFSEATF